MKHSETGGGVTVAQVMRDLAVAENVLRRWIRDSLHLLLQLFPETERH
jgi:hypothetical protein